MNSDTPEFWLLSWTSSGSLCTNIAASRVKMRECWSKSYTMNCILSVWYRRICKEICIDAPNPVSQVIRTFKWLSWVYSVKQAASGTHGPKPPIKLTNKVVLNGSDDIDIPLMIGQDGTSCSDFLIKCWAIIHSSKQNRTSVD